MKSQVYALAKEVGVIESILNARPTDGLFSYGRTDEDQIGATYDELEWTMNYIESKSTAALSDRQKIVLDIFTRMNKANQHKMNPVPVCIIPDKLK